MPEMSTTVEIPKRALFKASEVCDLARVQPYVLRSWEAEFPHLGLAKQTNSPRVYRRSDVEHVLRIKHLLLVEGLTLAGARKRLEEESTPVAVDAPLIDELLGQNARERLTVVKRGLQSILDLLAGRDTGGLPRVVARPTPVPRQAASGPRPAARKAARGKAASSRSSASHRRKH